MLPEAALYRDRAAIGSELLGAWAAGRRVCLRLDAAGNDQTLVGYLSYVAPSGAFVHIDDKGDEPIHVPVFHVLSVRYAHFHSEDLVEGPRPPGPRIDDPFPGQLSLVDPLPVSSRGEAAMMRAARNMLPPDVLRVLAAVDEAGRLPGTGRVAEGVMRSERWTRARLRELERLRYLDAVFVKGQRRWKILR